MTMSLTVCFRFWNLHTQHLWRLVGAFHMEQWNSYRIGHLSALGLSWWQHSITPVQLVLSVRAKPQEALHRKRLSFQFSYIKPSSKKSSKYVLFLPIPGCRKKQPLFIFPVLLYDVVELPLGQDYTPRHHPWSFLDPASNIFTLRLSSFSRVWLSATPQTAAHQAPLSLGFSRQEHWSGLPFPSPMHESEKWKWSRSVMSDS